jgi:hypothetical protein
MKLSFNFPAKLLLVLATIPLYFLGEASAQAEVIKETVGSIQAELSYQKIEDFKFSEIRLKVNRQGQMVLDQRVDVDSEFERPVIPNYSNQFAKEQPFLRDLDKDGEPEVMVGLYTGGAHCCTYSLIYRYLPNQNTYTSIRHEWGNGGYLLKDLGQDGIPEFYSRDDRFAYEFTAYAASFYPLQLWRYQQGNMMDVTRQFPQEVYSHAYQLWKDFERIRREGIDANGLNVKGVLAAYLADKYLLGQEADGWQRLRQVYQLADREKYFSDLRVFLQNTGYSQESR